MKNILTQIALFIFCATSLLAQTNPPPPVVEVVEDIKGSDEAPPSFYEELPASVRNENDTYELFDIQVQPQFPGGEAAMMQYLGNNIRYPALARENNVQGSVVVSFVVEKDGSVSSVTLIKDIGAGCGKEAMRVVSAMPRWTPGQANNQPVRVRYTLPIRFRLEGEDDAADKEKPTAASFPGGQQAMDDWFAEHLNYPKKDKRKKVEGVVNILCDINAEGKTENLRIQKSVSPNCDKEALRLVSAMPRWKPATGPGNKALKTKNVIVSVPFQLPK